MSCLFVVLSFCQIGKAGQGLSRIAHDSTSFSVYVFFCLVFFCLFFFVLPAFTVLSCLALPCPVFQTGLACSLEIIFGRMFHSCLWKLKMASLCPLFCSDKDNKTQKNMITKGRQARTKPKPIPFCTGTNQIVRNRLFGTSAFGTYTVFQIISFCTGTNHIILYRYQSIRSVTMPMKSFGTGAPVPNQIVLYRYTDTNGFVLYRHQSNSSVPSTNQIVRYRYQIKSFCTSTSRIVLYRYLSTRSVPVPIGSLCTGIISHIVLYRYQSPIDSFCTETK